MSAALSFALISVFALGIPTCALSLVVLNRSRDVDSCFLAFQVALLLLMLADALIFFRGAGGSVASSGQADPMPILFVASHALQCLPAVSLFLLAAEITAMDGRSAARKIGMACVVFISAGVCWYAFAVQHGDAGYFDKIRHFDPGEALGLVICLYPVALVLLCLSRIKEKRMAKAVIPFEIAA